MKVLVTGAAGFIGKALVERLVSEGHAVRALIRAEKRKEVLKTLTDDFFVGDVTKPETISGCADGVDVVIHIAGKLGEFGAGEEVYENIHVNGTRNILLEAVNAKVKHFIHTSSAGVLGPLSKCPADESFPYNPSNTYERTKCEAEKLVINSCREKGIRYTVLRPEFVYGPGDLHVLGLFKAIRDGKFFFIGSGKTYLHPTYIDSVVQSYILSLADSNESGVYLITGERAVSVRELAGIIANKFDVPPPKLSIPFWFALLGARVLEFLSSIFGIKPPLSVSGVKFFCEDRSFDSALARKKLGFKPLVTLEEGIGKTIDWYKKEGHMT